MFNTIKSNIDLLDVISKDLDLNLKECGTDTFCIEDERDHGGCPFCGHMDCFKVKSDGVNSMYKCFSCDEHGDVIEWRAKRKTLTPVDAARELAKEYNIALPTGFSPIQEIFNVAANYYHSCLTTTCNKPNRKLSDMTPLEYQKRVRKHSDESIEHFNIGWSDGRLVEFLESLGYDRDLITESGLLNKKTGKDYLPSDCFIYPHYTKGKVSHFTFKDPLKKLSFQLRNESVLNGIEFYNQDSCKDSDSVLIVEGENDVISVWDHTEKGKLGVIGAIGSISNSQLIWLKENLGSKHIVTCFDPDPAGDKYREKVEKLKQFFKSLNHVYPPEEKDIDEHLAGGKVTNLIEFLNSNIVEVTPQSAGIIITPGGANSAPTKKYQPPEELSSGETKVDGSSTSGVNIETTDAIENNSIIERDRAYYKLKFKESGPEYVKISNCVVRLLNVFIDEEGNRTREIKVVKENGFTSDPINVDSDTKVSLRLFRTLLAKAADADFKGSEMDLSAMWELVYSKGGENQVRTTRMVGRVEKTKGWIFRNKYISDTGATIDPDETGIFWLSGKTVGIKAESLNKNNHDDGEDLNIPYLNDQMTAEEREDLTNDVIHYLSSNLADPGQALIMLGWMNACAYSNTIFKMNRNFPMLFIWGTAGQGKGSVCSWIMDIYDLSRTRTAVAQIKSGVGLARKASYYASLPLWVDEIRADKETTELQSTLRDYFDRGSRPLGTKDGHTIREQIIRCCMMFSGEDQFTDPATKDRCLMVRLGDMKGPGSKRESEVSFRWMNEHQSILSGIGYKWILESANEDHNKLKEEISKLDKDIREATKGSARKSKSWAIVGVFAIRLAQKYLPNFDMRKYLYSISIDDSAEQKKESTVAQFFEHVEILMAKDGNQKSIDHKHIKVDGDIMSIWFASVYKAVQDSCKGQFPFSRNAVLGAIREEPFFHKERTTAVLGMHRRDVVQINVKDAPDYIKNISEACIMAN